MADAETPQVTATFDPQGNALAEILEGKNFRWLSPPAPHWRIEPPTLVRWLLTGGWRRSDYDIRLKRLLTAILHAYPGACLAFAHEPKGLSGSWSPVDFGNPDWKAPERGAYVRALEGNHRPKAFRIPTDLDIEELSRFLAPGGWAIWKPGAKTQDVGVLPRLLSQDVLRTVQDSHFEMLMISSWDNQFTEIALAAEPRLEAQPA